MIKKIIHFSVYHPWAVLTLVLLMALAGWFSFKNLPIDAVPDITNIQVQINTPVEGLTPEEIERSITFPVENAMNGIQDVIQVRSITRYGLSQVTVVFEEGTSISLARQWVSERLQRVLGELPEEIKPQLGPISTGLGEIFQYAVEAEEVKTGSERIKQLMELRVIQDWYIKPRLLSVKGIAEVNTIGGFERQFHIRPKLDQMAYYGIHFDDLVEAIEKTNRNVGGSYIQQTGEQFLVQAIGLLTSLEQIRKVPVKSLQTFKTITIEDVADVELGTELRTGAGLVRGEESVIGTAMMLMGENSRTVSKRVSEKLEEIKKGLPPGIKVEALYDRSELVNATLATVEHNLLMGAVLVVIILLLLIGNLRAALLTALTIPLALLFTFLVMKPLGLSGNLMSLGALDFGIIVDGVVIVLDNCIRLVHHEVKRLGRRLTRQELKDKVFQGASEVRAAAGFGELIIVVVFIPLFGLTGIEGKMFIPMAATFMIALVGGLALSFTAAPALASLFLSTKASDKEPFFMLWIKKIYQLILKLALKLRWATIALAVAAVVLAFWLFSRLGGEFLPQLDEGSIAVQFIRPPDISIDQSIALQGLSEKLLSEFQEVKVVFSRLGTGEVATDPMGVNVADTFVLLKDKKEWPIFEKKPRSKQELIQAMVEKLEAELPGQRILMTQPIQMRFNELLEGTRADISLKIFGDDLEKLQELAQKMTSVIREVPGAGDVEVEVKGKSPILKIKPQEELLRELGVSDKEVLETVGTALAGRVVGPFYEGVRRFLILIRLDEAQRSNLEALQQLPVGLLSNITTPLGKIADLQFEEAYTAIYREQSQRRAGVLINPRGRDTESFVEEAQQKVEAEVKLPSGYFAEWGGNFKNLQEAKERLIILVPGALLLVLMMIYAAFRNFSQTLLVFSGVPLALVGGVLGLIFNGLPFSISAGVGFIALSGIAVLNGIVLMNFYNQLEEQGVRGKELIVQGASIRLRPVLMTALVDIFGFLPMMLSTGVGAEVQKPLASVVIGGIISSTFLTLIVLPTIYSWIAKRREDIEI